MICDAEIYHLCILAKPLSKDTRLSGDEDTIITNYKLESHVKTTCSFLFITYHISSSNDNDI